MENQESIAEELTEMRTVFEEKLNKLQKAEKVKTMLTKEKNEKRVMMILQAKKDNRESKLYRLDKRFNVITLGSFKTIVLRDDLNVKFYILRKCLMFYEKHILMFVMEEETE